MTNNANLSSWDTSSSNKATVLVAEKMAITLEVENLPTFSCKSHVSYGQQTCAKTVTLIYCTSRLDEKH